MKKILLFSICLTFTIFSFSQQTAKEQSLLDAIKQKGIPVITDANGTVPDFTMTDMNGTTQHLYSYLNAGKCVILDIFETT